MTFTVPAEFRSLFYAHQKNLYALLFGVIWETLQSFSQNDKQLQALPVQLPCYTPTVVG